MKNPFLFPAFLNWPSFDSTWSTWPATRWLPRGSCPWAGWGPAIDTCACTTNRTNPCPCRNCSSAARLTAMFILMVSNVETRWSIFKDVLGVRNVFTIVNFYFLLAVLILNYRVNWQIVQCIVHLTSCIIC